MFLENDYARPLFDFQKGGEARAYECIMPHHVLSSHPPYGVMVECKCGIVCGKITKTEAGMRAHLKTVHKWEEKPCLYSTDSQSGGEPRQLRAGPPQLKSSDQPSLMETTTVNQEPPEMNGEESLKPTREEN